MAILLRWLDRTTLPVDADALSPRSLAGLDARAVARVVVPVGRDEQPVGELFAVEDDPAGPDDLVRFEGDLGHVRGLGRGMDRGRIEVLGTAGAHLGEGLSGGSIEVHGDTGDWTGAGMTGGLVRVRGNAGRYLGAALPGSRVGMRDGVVLVDGNAGEGAGERMRRGLIAIGGSAAGGLGSGMIAGTVLVFGDTGRPVGMGMRRGTIGLFGAAPVLLPSFVPTGRYRYPFLAVYLRQLAAWGFDVPDRVTTAALERYNGDRAGGGQGELLVLADVEG